MPKRSSRAPNQTAFNVVQQATGNQPETTECGSGKNPAAVALGRLGGKKGGKARAERLSAKKRADIARIAAAARWKKS